jgi:DNA-dependent protein kinase catalytic subunit
VNLGNIKSLFKRLYSLAHHPNAYKRLGFALALVQIVPILNGYPPVVDTFVFEILQNAIFCLRLSDSDDQSTGEFDW